MAVSRGVPKSVQLLFYGIEAVMVLNWIILNSRSSGSLSSPDPMRRGVGGWSWKVRQLHGNYKKTF